jgi:stage V sporulation protein G
MNITEVKISPISGDEKLKAFATVTFDDCFLVRDLKIINGKKGFFVAMPSRKMKDGTFKDIAHPLNNAMRQQLETRVLEEYNKSIEEPKS